MSFSGAEDLLRGGVKGTKGEHEDANKELTKMSLDDLNGPVAERRNKDVRFIYCLVFPAVPKEDGKMDQLKAKIGKKTEKLDENELEEQRVAILKHIHAAGFTTELFYTTTKKEIICKIGVSDERLLIEADNQDYKLQLDPSALQYVLEAGETIKEEVRGEMVDKTRFPIYLGYKQYDKSAYGEFEGPNIFRYNDTHMMFGGSAISLDTAKKSFFEQSKMDPFESIHIEYKEEWEERIASYHNVQIYRTYNDKSVFRTADRISLTRSALAAERVNVNGAMGAGLNLKKMQFDKEILAFYPIQFSETAREAGDLTAEALYAKWKVKIPVIGEFFVPWIQPLDDIRDYAGEKIAYYFAFLGFYSFWLIIASLAGIVVFIVQLGELNKELGTLNFLTASAQVQLINRSQLSDLLSDDELNFIPIAEFPAKPASAVAADKVLFVETPTELEIIPYYSLFIALWATFFLEFWKREQSRLALRWGMSSFEREAEVRPEFKSQFDTPDAVTGLPVPYRSNLLFGLKVGTAFGIIATAVGVTISAFTATYVFKVFMSTSTDLDPTVAPQIALVVNAGAIIFLGVVFKKMAKMLTDWENHRTDIEFEDMLIAKTFIFTFFNSYTTLIYFAFVKKGSELLGQTQFCITQLETYDIDNPDCEEAGACFSDKSLAEVDSCYGAVGYSLAIIFVSQIIVNNTMEIGIPMAKIFVKKYFGLKSIKKRAELAKQQMDSAGAKVGDMAKKMDVLNVAGDGPIEEKHEEPLDIDEKLPLKSPAENQFILAPYETPFDDYLELALQFGYVTLFVAAFPLAPVLALLNNMVEVWVDAQKVCILSRRPNLPKAQDIGTWLYIFTILAYFAVILNSGLIVFTSNTIIRVATDRDDIRVWLFLIFILAVMLIKYVADYFIRDIPLAVEVQLKRQEYFLRKVFFVDEDDPHRNDILKNKHNKNGQEVDVTDDDKERFVPADQDSFLDFMIEEMKKYMKECNIDEHKVFDEIDTNKNGEISLDELKKFLSKKEGGIGEYMDVFEVKLVISALDMDEDGTISREEFAKFLHEDHTHNV